MELKPAGEAQPMLVRLNPDDPLFDQALALEKLQEDAVRQAGTLLGEKFGATAEVANYSMQNGAIVVVYKLTKPQQEVKKAD